MKLRLYFTITASGVHVQRAKSPAATFFHGDDVTSPDSNHIEALGLLTPFDCLNRGYVRRWINMGDQHVNWKTEISIELDRLNEAQKHDIVEFLRLRSKGFETKFLEDLDGVK